LATPAALTDLLGVIGQAAILPRLAGREYAHVISPTEFDGMRPNTDVSSRLAGRRLQA
jgi:hypothetical protein